MLRKLTPMYLPASPTFFNSILFMFIRRPKLLIPLYACRLVVICRVTLFVTDFLSAMFKPLSYAPVM